MEAQKKAILAHMMNGRSISQIEAANLFGCWRLGARIFNIREDGIDVITEMVKSETTGKRFARYYLTGDEIESIKND